MRRRGAQPVLLNTGQLVENPVSYGSGLAPRIGDVWLEEVTSIWYRRLFPTVMPDGMEQRWRDWGQQEFSQAGLALLDSLDLPSIDAPWKTRRAALKGLQLARAAEIGGFTVPPYVITSDAGAAQHFVNEICGGDAVVKVLGRPVVKDGHNWSNFFTEPTGPLSPGDLDGLKYAPCIFQKRIDAVREFRVTLVDGQVFAGSFDRSGLDAADYRKADPYSLPHRAEALDDATSAACREMAGAFGLRYAAIDLLEDKHGNLFFLELNPVGQWLWMEELTGLPIADAMADALCRTADSSAVRDPASG